MRFLVRLLCAVIATAAGLVVFWLLSFRLPVLLAFDDGFGLLVWLAGFILGVLLGFYAGKIVYALLFHAMASKSDPEPDVSVGIKMLVAEAGSSVLATGFGLAVFALVFFAPVIFGMDDLMIVWSWISAVPGMLLAFFVGRRIYARAFSVMFQVSQPH